jgi:peptidoglycan/LPS O-acetylase OafA/YrhL
VRYSDGQLNSSRFFINRLNRLAPLYLFHVCVIVVLALSVRSFQLWESGFTLARNIMSWFAFGILGQPDINQAPKTFTIDAGVIWTLAYEWAFYLALPLMACFHKGRRFLFLLIIIFAYGVFVQSISSITLFGYGMVAAYLVKKYGPIDFFKSNWLSLAACILLFAAYNSDGQVRSMLFFLIFTLIVHGNSLFGVLKTSPAKLLGAISYSIYLLQGAVLYTTLRLIDHFTSISGMDQWTFLLTSALCGTMLIAVSAVTYQYIEHPFIVASHSGR